MITKNKSFINLFLAIFIIISAGFVFSSDDIIVSENHFESIPTKSSQSDIKFDSNVDFAAGINPISVSAGDIDGDGKHDIAVANLNNNTVSVLLNTSDSGNVSFAPKVDFNTGANPRSVKFGDIDGDGKLDLVVSNNGSNSVSVLRNTSFTGNISFAARVNFTTGAGPRNLSIGDLDGDGKLDLAVPNDLDTTVSIFRNTSVSGIVNFSPKVDLVTGTEPLSASIGNINGDTKPDLTVTNYFSNTVSVFRNNSDPGTINFAQKVDFTTGTNPYDVKIGDLDGDGKSDLAVSNNSSNTVSVFRNTSASGNVNFDTKDDFITGTTPNHLSIGDLDGDGKSELAVSNTNSNTISVFRNTSAIDTISFSAKSDFGTGTNPYSVNIDDIDGDNKSDMFTANRNSNTVSILRNLNTSLNKGAEITLYAIGKIPIGIGMPDTLRIEVKNNIIHPATNLFVHVKIISDSLIQYDTTYSLERHSIYSTTISLRLPRFSNPQNNIIIVEALPGSLLEGQVLFDTIYDSKQYRQNITYDAYNYSDPLLDADGGFGVRGSAGNIVAKFRNNDLNSIVIGSVEQSFFDSVGSGNKSYNIVIYGDSSNNKPGPLLYISPNLTTPPGTGAAKKVIYEIENLVTIPANSRFYIGYRQNTINPINASFQNENPVRDSSFFFTNSNSGNAWHDFADSSKNYRFDISPILGNTILNLKYIMQGFYNSISKKLSMSDSIIVYLRQPTSPFAIVDTSKGKIDSMNFSKSFAFNKVTSGNYYIDVRHRNCIETWSNMPISITKKQINDYYFISAASQAYGNNLVQADNSPQRFAAFSGDVNQNGIVDLSDITLTYNGANSFFTGYVKTDLTGDNMVDLTDLVLGFNNSASFVAKITP